MLKEQKKRFNELKRKNFNGGLTEEEAQEYLKLAEIWNAPKKSRWQKKVKRLRQFDKFWIAHRDGIFLGLIGANVILCALGTVLSLIKMLKG